MDPQESQPGHSSRRRKKPLGNEHAYTDDDLAMFKEAYEEGKRSLDDQVAELDSMRQRSAQFLAFAGSATAFLVGTGLDATADVSRPVAFYGLAIAASAVSLVAIVTLVAILLAIGSPLPGPRDARVLWKFRTSPRTLVQEWIDPQIGGLKPALFYRELALAYQRNMDQNESSLRRVRFAYTVFLVSGSMQVLMWGALVWIFA